MTQPCFICGKQPRPVWRGDDPEEDGPSAAPYGATMFTTRGHYGSTVFDEMDRTSLRVTICDDHLLEGARQGRVLHVTEVRAPSDPVVAPWDVSDREWCKHCGRAVGVPHDRHDDEPPF